MVWECQKWNMTKEFCTSWFPSYSTLHFYILFLGAERNTQTHFHASFFAFPNPSNPILRNHEAPKPLFMLHFLPSQALPTLRLGTMKHALPTPRLWTMKHPTPFSCFVFGVPRPFPPHSWEPWSTQTLFHASFWAFPNPSHPTLGNHEIPNSFFMLHFEPS